MRRDPRAYLWDVREAADAIAGFVQSRSFDDYAGDLMLRSAWSASWQSLVRRCVSLQGLTKAWPRVFQSCAE